MKISLEQARTYINKYGKKWADKNTLLELLDKAEEIHIMSPEKAWANYDEEGDFTEESLTFDINKKPSYEVDILLVGPDINLLGKKVITKKSLLYYATDDVWNMHFWPENGFQNGLCEQHTYLVGKNAKKSEYVYVTPERYLLNWIEKKMPLIKSNVSIGKIGNSRLSNIEVE